MKIFQRFRTTPEIFLRMPFLAGECSPAAKASTPKAPALRQKNLPACEPVWLKRFRRKIYCGTWRSQNIEMVNPHIVALLKFYNFLSLFSNIYPELCTMRRKGREKQTEY
jgi:hypothetical protein